MNKPLTLDDGITLLNGHVFNFEDPAACKLVTINDLATPLSHICRFAGQLPYFYSVAQHAVNVSRLVPEEHAYAALMHDTSEAFTNDIVTPLKHRVPIFKELEARIEADMGRRFGFQYPLPDEVHIADRQMLGLEMVHIRGQKAADWEHLNGVQFEHLRDKVDLTEWTPSEARARFLERYEFVRPKAGPLDLKANIEGEATFQYFRGSDMIYKTAHGLSFPVPVTDVGAATFHSVEKASLMMRWIRKEIELQKADQ